MQVKCDGRELGAVFCFADDTLGVLRTKMLQQLGRMRVEDAQAGGKGSAAGKLPLDFVFLLRGGYRGRIHTNSDSRASLFVLVSRMDLLS